MPESSDREFGEKLHRLIETFDIANVLTEPLRRSIEELLRLSASQLKSGEASVLIRDGEDGDLRFLSAIGQVAGSLVDLKIPAGKGIAGFVFSSGQPMAVADVGETDTFYAEVDRTTGYSTQMILATPLRHNDEVIGVLEYVNRSTGPPFEPFTPDEMDTAALFADAIGSMVSAYESAKLFREAGQWSLNADAELNPDAVRDWLAGIRAAPQHREMMELAVLIRELAGRGPAERQMCAEVLRSVINFSDRTNDSSFLL